MQYSWVPLVPLAAAALVDLRSREVPDWIPVSLLVWSVLATTAGWARGWTPLLLGLTCGIALAFLLFRFASFGGGDVKLLAALGAACGWPDFALLLYYSAIAGGLLALVALLRGHRDLAYAPALALGFTALLMTRA